MQKLQRIEGHALKVAEGSKSKRSTICNGAPKRKPSSNQDVTLLKGDVLKALAQVPLNSCDLIISSPPYNIGKDYERSSKLSFEDYLIWQDRVIEALVERLRNSGSICWQVG